MWLVDGQGLRVRYPTIQAAVDAGLEGETVLLSDGLFTGPGNRGVLVTGKNLTIRSENGPSNCIIDCSGKNRAFRFDAPGIGTETLLRGITILNGNAPNDVSGRFGGGVFCNLNTRPTIEGCVISACDAGGGGAIAYNLIDPNPMGTVRDCVLSGNSASDGGAIRAFCVVIDRCWVIDNFAGIGGGIWLAASGVVRDSVIARNSTPVPVPPLGGGGLFIDDSVLVESCTIVDNAGVFGGAIATGICPAALVSNCIIWGNTQLTPQVYQGLSFGFSNLTVRYCDIEGGEGSVGGNPPAEPVVLAVLDVDPGFVNRSAGDYHLSPGSPVADVGDPEIVPAVNEGDYDNQPRANGRIDMGADEFYAGLALSLFSPGRAGETNAITIRGAAAGEQICLFGGLAAGITPVPTRHCPGLTVQIENAELLATRVADATGTAVFTGLIPPLLTGRTLHLQAVAGVENTLGPGCSVSNLASFTFP